jgi:hypothetical protein
MAAHRRNHSNVLFAPSRLGVKNFSAAFYRSDLTQSR